MCKNKFAIEHAKEEDCRKCIHNKSDPIVGSVGSALNPHTVSLEECIYRKENHEENVVYDILSDSCCVYTCKIGLEYSSVPACKALCVYIECIRYCKNCKGEDYCETDIGNRGLYAECISLAVYRLVYECTNYIDYNAYKCREEEPPDKAVCALNIKELWNLTHNCLTLNNCGLNKKCGNDTRNKNEEPVLEIRFGCCCRSFLLEYEEELGVKKHRAYRENHYAQSNCHCENSYFLPSIYKCIVSKCCNIAAESHIEIFDDVFNCRACNIGKRVECFWSMYYTDGVVFCITIELIYFEFIVINAYHYSHSAIVEGILMINIPECALAAFIYGTPDSHYVNAFICCRIIAGNTASDENYTSLFSFCCILTCNSIGSLSTAV